MNLQQLQYIIAVEEHQHFQKAAEACYITPATLSMMIKKLEQELNVIIFDRSKQPIKTTDIGKLIVDQAKNILCQVDVLNNIAQFNTEDVAGQIRLGIIPTLAPYLIHLFLPKLLHNFPQLSVQLFEFNTTEMVAALKHNKIDIGIAATPVNEQTIHETTLFYEKLFAYVDDPKISLNKTYIAPKDINLKKLWLLSEEHCLRSQVINLCSLKKQEMQESQFVFEAGSIETLLNIVGTNNGITIIPELVIPTLSRTRKQKVLPFKDPSPVREISLLTYQYFSKQNILNALSTTIAKSVKPYISESEPQKNQIIQIN